MTKCRLVPCCSRRHVYIRNLLPLLNVYFSIRGSLLQRQGNVASLSRDRKQQELVYLNRQVYKQTLQWRFNSDKTFNINFSRRKLRHLTATLTPAWIGQLQTTD